MNHSQLLQIENKGITVLQRNESFEIADERKQQSKECINILKLLQPHMIKVSECCYEESM